MSAAKLIVTVLVVLLGPFAVAAEAELPESRCLIGTDPAFDSAAAPPAWPRDPAAEILALFMGADESSLTVSLQVAGFAPPPSSKRTRADVPHAETYALGTTVEAPAASADLPKVDVDPHAASATGGRWHVDVGRSEVSTASHGESAPGAEGHGPVPSMDAGGNAWDVVWFVRRPVIVDPYNPEEGGYGVSARRSQGVDTFWYHTPSGKTMTIGAVDEESGVIHVVMPRAALPDGARLTKIGVSASTVRAEIDRTRDSMSNMGPSTMSFVPGTVCQDDLAQPCPVVTDQSNDANAVDSSIDGSSDRLDVTAVGAESIADLVRVSVRVRDLGGRPPWGLNTSGWTVSWDYAGIRWAAQAEQYRDGSVTFRYAATNADPGELPGVVGGGLATTGALDPVSGLLQIDVPRWAVGSPAEGDLLSHLGAQTWAARTGDQTVAPYSFFDVTETRHYRVGVPCGA